jgi:hypothetical protein
VVVEVEEVAVLRLGSFLEIQILKRYNQVMGNKCTKMVAVVEL